MSASVAESAGTAGAPLPELLPSGWRRVKLREVCEINPRRPSNLARGDEEPTVFVPMSAVDEVRGVVAFEQFRPFAELKKGYTYFAEGDVLFAKITPCMQNGKHAVARNLAGGFGFASTEFHVIRPRQGVSAEWIHYFLRQPSVLLAATRSFTGTAGQQRVPPEFLQRIEIPLPPVEEQKRIVSIINEQIAAVERARRAVDEELAAIDALPAALLRRAFKGEL